MTRDQAPPLGSLQPWAVLVGWTVDLLGTSLAVTLLVVTLGSIRPIRPRSAA
jgi:hypothetical protein